MLYITIKNTHTFFHLYINRILIYAQIDNTIG